MPASGQMSSQPSDALDDSRRDRRASRAGPKPDSLSKPSIVTLPSTLQSQTKTEKGTELGMKSKTEIKTEPFVDISIVDKNAERVAKREKDLEASREKEKDMENKIATLCKELELERLRSKEAVAEVSYFSLITTRTTF